MNKVRFGSNEITPSKVVCVGRNYVAHIHELGNEIPQGMVLFVKPNSAISAQLASSHNGDQLHYEAELSYLYEKGKFTAVAIGLDLTKREVQSQLKAKSLPWERSKAFDGSALFTDFVPVPEEGELALRLSINDECVQQGGTSLMIYQPDVILEEVQSFMSLEDGDIIMTGTPAGVGNVPANAKFTASLLCDEQEIHTAQWVADQP
ncbi:FAA hydrolase family protein [Photobacterium sanctipauli]|uniref:FAA hydrolase family protein n=1 Tax=Photobacterium sanctipauli TaxID=1342794 RepID=A0A2T3NUD2_9GAMM|nr:fumarylacetoacetate hydrolase family protein [Photobacterium sanctipauli]PSW19863.1 FAA hydrolase family protein [Photobacterium sanctipauli]